MTDQRDTILIVDDMEVNRVILRGAFEKNYVAIQSPTTNNRHTLQRRLNCKEGTYAVLESCTCI